MSKPERDKLFTRWGALKSERSSWLTHWREISDYLLPRSGRFLTTDRNKGDKRHNNIYDSTGTRALRVLAAGMMAGMTSPARPWFRLATADPEMMASEPVKVWLHDVQRLVLDVFARSNTYRALHSMYEELGAYGTSASITPETLSKRTPSIGESAVPSSQSGFFPLNTMFEKENRESSRRRIPPSQKMRMGWLPEAMSMSLKRMSDTLR